MRQMANAWGLRMLEDPSYDSIVRWGEGGESFVVLNVRNQVEYVPLNTNAPPRTRNLRR
jgi:hypothetical protein